MKKGPLFTCDILSIALIGLVAIFAGAIAFFGLSYVNSQNDVAAKLIGNSVPKNYYTIFAQTNLDPNVGEDKTYGVALLWSNTKNIALLIDTVKMNDEQEVIQFFKDYRLKSSHSSDPATTEFNDIKPDGEIDIKGKSFKKYLIKIKTDGNDMNGMLVAMNHGEKTLFVAYVARPHNYNENGAIDFLEQINIQQ